jgi:glycosyltransferase involved in cell wall biosynthesis
MNASAFTPKVSVILPVYNGAETVETAIRSILAQTFENFELLIVNDGSTDKTAIAVDSIYDPRIRVFHLQRNVGRSKARNIGISESRGPYVAMTDADDVSYPDRLRLQVSFMESHPEIAMCGTWAHMLLPSGRKVEWRRPTEPEVIKRCMLSTNTVIHPTILVRKKVLDEVGGFDESLEPAEDYDLYLRIASRYQVANLPYILAEYRAHTNFRYRLHEQWAKVPVRWKAIFEYGYPRSNLVYLATPLIGLLMPLRLKLALKGWTSTRAGNVLR